MFRPSPPLPRPPAEGEPMALLLVKAGESVWAEPCPAGLVAWRAALNPDQLVFTIGERTWSLRPVTLP